MVLGRTRKRFLLLPDSIRGDFPSCMEEPANRRSVRHAANASEGKVSFETFDIIGGTPATLLVDIDEVATIVNADATNTLTIGDNHAIQPGDQKTVPFGPGQTLSTDGSQQIWGVISGTKALAILKFPGTVSLIGQSAQAPTGTPPKVASAVASSGNTVDIIGNALNPSHLPIQIVVAALSSFVAAAAPTAFNAQDSIQDTAGNTYIPLQVGLPSSGGICAPTLAIPFGNAVVPAGAKLQLNNGGGSGALHQCAAVVSYYLVGGT
jgi:hypothetical protein